MRVGERGVAIPQKISPGSYRDVAKTTMPMQEDAISNKITKDCIYAALRDQEKAIANLQEYIMQLRNRIDPILIPREQNPEPTQGKPERLSSQLYCEIVQNSELIRNLTAVVIEILDRADL